MLSQYLIVVITFTGRGLLRGFAKLAQPPPPLLIPPPFKYTVGGPENLPNNTYGMSNINGSKSGNKRMRDRVVAEVRNFGHRLSIPSFGGRSRSPSPAPSPSSGRKKPSDAAVTPCTQALPTTNTSPSARLLASSYIATSSTTASPTGTGPATFPASPATTRQPAASIPALAQAPPTLTIRPRTLSPLEIRQRTADLLEKRLTPREVEKIKWDETTEEQAKAVVEGLQKSLEGKPEYKGMYKTMQYINKYSTIIDVAVQHQPCITALVWAGVRTVIQVGDRLLSLYSYLSSTTGYLYDHRRPMSFAVAIRCPFSYYSVLTLTTY